MTEKEQIEKATAESFLSLYNAREGTDYQIIRLSDSPDVECQNSSGSVLNLEITMTEDRPGDIMAALGRSEHRNLDSLIKQLKKAEEMGEDPPHSSLAGNVLEMLVSRIKPKLSKNYGPNTALVLRDASPLDWDWNSVSDGLKVRLEREPNFFDKGIWIVNRSLTSLYLLM